MFMMQPLRLLLLLEEVHGNDEIVVADACVGDAEDGLDGAARVRQIVFRVQLQLDFIEFRTEVQIGGSRQKRLHRDENVVVRVADGSGLQFVQIDGLVGENADDAIGIAAEQDDISEQVRWLRRLRKFLIVNGMLQNGAGDAAAENRAETAVLFVAVIEETACLQREIVDGEIVAFDA